MAESGWAKRMAQEFRAAKARKDAQTLEERRAREESVYKLYTDLSEAFKRKAQMFNGAVGEEIVTWEADRVNPFTLRGKDIEGCVRGTYYQAAREIKVEVLGRLTVLQVVFDQQTGEFRLFGAGGEACEPEELAETLIGEFLAK